MKILFIMEQTLGHITHTVRLREQVEREFDIDAEWLLVPFDAPDRWQNMPLVSENWTLRASLRTRDMVRQSLQKQTPDLFFFHTQVTALFAGEFRKLRPTVVSMDATPQNVDTVEGSYGLKSGSRLVERFKNSINRRAFSSASHLITWCDWARRSLINDYGIEENKITVIPPGVDSEIWSFDRSAREAGPVRMLFVGGDFQRKGGELLLDTFKILPAGIAELDIVTRDTVNTHNQPGVRIHHGLQSGCKRMLQLYHNADMFVFPTLGDCLPIAVMEAMMAGLPVIASRVGALDEEVLHGQTGLLIPPDDGSALLDAMLQMVKDEPSRRAMGQCGRATAANRFNAVKNYGAVLQQLRNTI